MIDLMGSSGVDMFRTWHIFGDPSLRILGSDCASPTTYCYSTPNSAGNGAEIGYVGSASIAAADLELTVIGAVWVLTRGWPV